MSVRVMEHSNCQFYETFCPCSFHEIVVMMRSIKTVAQFSTHKNQCSLLKRTIENLSKITSRTLLSITNKSLIFLLTAFITLDA
jgi:hypothetical protein